MKSFTSIGLDIGSYSIKCVQLAVSKDARIVQQASIIPLGEQTSDNLPALLKPVLPMLTAAESVRVVLSGSSLLVRCIQLPVMTQKELKSAIRFEAENHIAFPIDDCILDFQILNEQPQGDKKIMNVLLVAAKRDFIQEKLKMLLDLGVNPEVIDVDTFCLVNAFETLNTGAEEPVQALLNIGYHVSSLAILKDKLPLFVREIPVGGVSVTKALAELKSVEEHEAERLKTEKSPEMLEDLRAATQKGLDPLVEAVKQSLDYFEQSAGQTFKSLWVSGGGALSVSALPVLAQGLGKDVSYWENLKKIEISGEANRQFVEEHANELNVAFGLALRD